MKKINEMYKNIQPKKIAPQDTQRLRALSFYGSCSTLTDEYTYRPIVLHIQAMLESIEENERLFQEAIADWREDCDNSKNWESPIKLHDYTKECSWENLINNEYNRAIRHHNISMVDGFTICISPKALSITYTELLDLTAKLECSPLVKQFFYYIEFYTDGSPQGDKPHIHIYGVPHKQTYKNRNAIRSYLVSIFKKYKKTTNISIERKKDITYGHYYITAPESDEKKKKNKVKDEAKRKELGIPDYFYSTNYIHEN